MGWHLLETLLQQVGEHSTLVGKLWVTATFVFRFIIVASVGDAVYSDEQSDFNCNTGQEGCENVCFNKFSPISHLRFWAAQILAVCTPSIVFIVYVTHILLESKTDNDVYDEEQDPLVEEPTFSETPKEVKKGRKMSRKSSTKSKISVKPLASRTNEDIGMVRGFTNPPAEATEAIEDLKVEENDGDEELGEKIEGEVDEYGMLKSLMNETRKQKRRKKRIQFFYVTTLFLRTGFEAVFIWLQYLLYGFSVPERYACQRKPCPHTVDCFVSRPQEKTYFLWFMMVVSCLCLVLNVVEIKYLGIKKLIKVLCSGPNASLRYEAKPEQRTERDGVACKDQGSKSSLKIADGERSPAGSLIGRPPVSDDGNKKKGGWKPDNDSIGFDAIGDPPSYPTPGYPFVHRYGIMVNTRPPAPIAAEVEKSYL